MDKKFIAVALIAILLVAIGGYFFPLVSVDAVAEKIAQEVQNKLGATGTRFPNGLSTDTTSPANGEVRTTDLTVTDDVTVTDDTTLTDALDVNGETTVQGFTQGAGALATSTSGAATTLTQTDLLANNFISLTINIGNFTYTLPATSTMTSLIPGTGDMREWIFENATTTAASTLTIAAGTGIDLISVTTADDVIDGTEYSRLTCIRQADTDVTCIVSELLASD